MAQEIATSKTLAATKGGLTVSKQHSVSITMTGDDMVQKSQVIGTAWEAVDFGEVTGVPAEVQIVNLDAINFVELALADDDTGIFAKLLAGRSVQIPLKSATLYARADTAVCRVSVLAVEA